MVEQQDNACHFDRYSCFASQTKDYSLAYLDEVLESRMASDAGQSFTQKLFASEALQIEKLKEECDELIEAKDHNHVRWEAADLLFFTVVMAKAKGVSIEEIVNDLRSRNHER